MLNRPPAAAHRPTQRRSTSRAGCGFGLIAAAACAAPAPAATAAALGPPATSGALLYDPATGGLALALDGRAVAFELELIADTGFDAAAFVSPFTDPATPAEASAFYLGGFGEIEAGTHTLGPVLDPALSREAFEGLWYAARLVASPDGGLADTTLIPLDLRVVPEPAGAALWGAAAVRLLRRR